MSIFLKRLKRRIDQRLDSALQTVNQRFDRSRKSVLEVVAIRLDSAVIVQWLVSISIEVLTPVQRRPQKGL
jgi:CRP-like cAMP-binding protein